MRAEAFGAPGAQLPQRSALAQPAADIDHGRRVSGWLFDLAGYADFLCEFLPLLRPDIVIQRLFGISAYDLLIAPQWGLGKSSIQAYLDREIQRRGVVQGSLFGC